MAKKSSVQAHPFFILAFILIAWILLPAVFKVVLRISFFELQAPAIQSVSITRDLQDYWAFRSLPKNELIRTVRDMTRLNASYELRMQENESLRREVQRLEQILDLPSRTEYRYEVARVAQRDFSVWWQRIIIRKGQNQNIPLGAPVVFTGGIVGKVSEVYLNTAVVDLVSSPTLRLSARIENDSRPVTYQGQVNLPFTPASGRVDFVPSDIRSDSRSRLVTSGLGGIFPPGITIGWIEEMDESADGFFQTGKVRLDQRLNKIKEVAVLIPLRDEIP